MEEHKVVPSLESSSQTLSFLRSVTQKIRKQVLFFYSTVQREKLYFKEQECSPRITNLLPGLTGDKETQAGALAVGKNPELLDLVAFLAFVEQEGVVTKYLKRAILHSAPVAATLPDVSVGFQPLPEPPLCLKAWHNLAPQQQNVISQSASPSAVFQDALEIASPVPTQAHMEQ